MESNVWPTELRRRQWPWSNQGHLNQFSSENKCIAYFSGLWSADDLSDQWLLWVWRYCFRYSTWFHCLCLKIQHRLMHEVNYTGRISCEQFFCCRIRLEELLYDAESDLWAIANFYDFCSYIIIDCLVMPYVSMTHPTFLSPSDLLHTSLCFVTSRIRTRYRNKITQHNVDSSEYCRKSFKQHFVNKITIIMLTRRPKLKILSAECWVLSPCHKWVRGHRGTETPPCAAWSLLKMTASSAPNVNKISIAQDRMHHSTCNLLEISKRDPVTTLHPQQNDYRPTVFIVDPLIDGWFFSARNAADADPWRSRTEGENW